MYLFFFTTNINGIIITLFSVGCAQDEMETPKSTATRPVAATVGRTAAVGRVRRIRTAQTTAQAARGGGTAPRTAGAQGVRAGSGGGGGRGHADVRWGVGGRVVAVVLGGRRRSRGRVHRRAVPGCGKRRALELPHHGRGHRAERVLRARVSHVTGRWSRQYCPEISARVSKTVTGRVNVAPYGRRERTQGDQRYGRIRGYLPTDAKSAIQCCTPSNVIVVINVKLYNVYSNRLNAYSLPYAWNVFFFYDSTKLLQLSKSPAWHPSVPTAHDVSIKRFSFYMMVSLQ